MPSRGQSAMVLDIQQHIRKLEQAINSINSARKHLQQSAMAVKSDIKMTITQQLESLRARELHLLQQVDLAQQAKDAALQGQEDQLHEALGGLQNMLSLGDVQGHGHVNETLAKVKNLNLSPKEIPNFAFKTSSSNLKEEINNYGNVDLQKLPLGALFDSEPSSTSLPKPFEDYNDEEHHVMYRPISNLGGTTPSTRQISVTIPCLSKKPEDWLFMPEEQLSKLSTAPAQQTVDSSPTFPRTMSANFVDWLDNHDELNRSVSSAASIQQWLCDIQGQGDVEEAEAEYEVISPPPCQPASTKGSSIEVLSMEEAQPIFVLPPGFSDSLSSLTITQDPKASLPYFQQVMAGPSNQWLLDATDDDAESDSSASYCDEVLSYFREVSNNTKDWLLTYTEKKKKEVDPELCVPTAICATNTGTVDIENLAELVCVQEPSTSDPKGWLLKQKDEDGDCDEMDVDEDVVTVCKANEPCQSFQQCLSDENCCSMLQPIQDVKSTPLKFNYFDSVTKQKGTNWLLSAPQAVVNPSPSETPLDTQGLFAPFSTPCHVRSWLLTAEVHSQDEDGVFFGAMNDVLQAPVDQWLRNSTTSSRNDLNKHDLQSILSNWSSRFTHKIPGQEGHKRKQDICPQHENKWLYSNPKPDEYFYDQLNIKNESILQGGGDSPVGMTPEKFKTLSWLLNTNQVEKNEKETEKIQDLGKQIELPECEDEPINDVHPAPNDVPFACFQQKDPSFNKWLATTNNLSSD